MNREPGLVHTLTRNFFWSENTLWLSELLRISSVPTVVLSELDEYVPSAEIKQRLEALNADCADEVVRIQFNAGSPHGGFIVDSKVRERIVELLLDPPSALSRHVATSWGLR